MTRRHATPSVRKAWAHAFRTTRVAVVEWWRRFVAEDDPVQRHRRERARKGWHTRRLRMATKARSREETPAEYVTR